MSNFILIIWVTLAPYQPAQLWELRGGIDKATCEALIAPRVAVAQQMHPGAFVSGQCFQQAAA